MRRTICLIAGLVSVAAAFAQPPPRHDDEDQHWATRSGLPQSEIRDIRIAAGITDVTPARVRNLDAVSLKQRNQILLVESQGYCMRLHVIERSAAGFKEIWSLTGLQDRGWSIDPITDRSGSGICSEAPRGPSAHVTPDGKIVVEVPTRSDPFQRSFPVETYSFVWDGAKYVLSRGL